jgi:hypothetical protein
VEEEMARIVIFLTAAALAFGATSALAGAQAGTSASAEASGKSAPGGAAKQGSESGSLAAGTALNAELNQSLDSKKTKPGESVTAHTTEAVKVDGKVVLPKGTRLVGHVTRASARAKGDQDSALALDFDRAVLKNGQEMPLEVTIQALAATREATAVSGDDLQGVGNVGAGAGTSNGAGRGMAGGVAGTASGAASTVPRTAQDATGVVNPRVNDAAGARAGTATGVTGGLNESGQLATTSRGVFGLNGLSLSAGVANSTEGSVVTSAGKNVHLDSGTRMLLVTRAEASGSASAER